MDIQSHQVTFNRAAHLKKNKSWPKGVKTKWTAQFFMGGPKVLLFILCVKMDALVAVLSRKCTWSGEKSKGSE